MDPFRRFRFLAAAAALAMSGTAMAQVYVEQPWLRPTVSGQQAGGGFAVLKSAKADRLIGASSPAAGRVELHTMTMDGNVMRMRQVDAIDLPAGQAVELKPGGLHLMLMDLKAPLVAGEDVSLTLRFEKAGEQTLRVPVRAVPTMPGAPSGHQHKH